MKKIILMALIIVSSISASGQKTVSWNVNVGVGNAGSYGNNIDLLDIKNKTAFKVGIGMEIPVYRKLSLQTGLNFSSKGAKRATDMVTDYKVNSLYLELPVMASIRIPVSDKSNILFKGGPYLAYGIGGKTRPYNTPNYTSHKSDASNINIGISNDIIFVKIFDGGTADNNQISVNDIYDDTDTFDFLDEFDYGLCGGVSFEFNKIALGIEADYGLNTIYDETYYLNKKLLGEVKAKNRSLFATLSYKF